jgi:hypothetical protein
VGLVALLALGLAPVAAADAWFPHPDGATWTYQWSDSTYATTPTTEQVTVKQNTGLTFVLAWTTDKLDPPNPPDAVKSTGTMTFQDTNAGPRNSDWASNPPPPSFPVLCAVAAGCPNTLTGTLYNLIWGSREPVLAEPLLSGFSWTSTGGAAADVASASTYLGTEQISVPAFPGPVTAAKVQTTITQAGALGDPYGSGVRTVWWVYGVGPVQIEFQHAGGTGAPLTEAVLRSTNQMPIAAPSDENYFPMDKGTNFTYRWTNSRWMKTPEIQQFSVDAVVNNSARITVKHISGPIKVAGNYGFATRNDGVTNLWATVQAVTRLKFPDLGPAGAALDKRRHFFTPFDLMVYGFNPVITAYPGAGDSWTWHNPSRDFSVFGVKGQTHVVGLQQVTVPAGTFQALVVESTLTQANYLYGNGTRTMWFVAGKGLVKLLFVHADGSRSIVVRMK